MNRLWILSVVGLFVLLSPTPVLACAGMAPNVDVDAFFDEVVEDLYTASPTIRDQCRRIAAARAVQVTIGLMPRSEHSCCRARTTIRRYRSTLVAAIEIPTPRIAVEYAELFGHELEHVLEQIEQAERQAPGAGVAGMVRLRDGAFETARARRAGETVAMEVEAAAATRAPARPAAR